MRPLHTARDRTERRQYAWRCVSEFYDNQAMVTPAIEVCHALGFVLVRYGVRVERFMMRVLELRFGQPFVIVHCAVPNELYLWYTRNGFEIRVEDRLLRFAGLVVTMTI